MKKAIAALLLLSSLCALELLEESPELFLSNHEIFLPGFYQAFNPSIIKCGQGFLLSFRYQPYRRRNFTSQLGVVYLDASLRPVGSPVILPLRGVYPDSFSFREDGRLVEYKGKIYIVYADFYDRNDFPVTIPWKFDPFWGACKEGIHIAELTYKAGEVVCGEPIFLNYPNRAVSQQREKNWTPFVWNDDLLFSYYISPHEVLKPDLTTGLCECVDKTFSREAWKWGGLRGGTPALLVDGEYLAFFHSSIDMLSQFFGEEKHHYFMGAYTFSSEPPFEVTKMSPKPIFINKMYKNHLGGWLIVFPGGYTVVGEKIYLSYGKNDNSLWVAILDKKALMKSLVSAK